MSYTCPVTFENVDSNISRFSALFVSILVVLYLLSLNPYILYYMAFDFYMRLFCKKDFSLILQTSKLLKFIFRMKDKMVDGGSKRLAGYFGIFFIILLVGLNHLHFDIASYIVGAIFLFCALLETLFDYCIGCKIYFIIKKIYPSFMT